MKQQMIDKLKRMELREHTELSSKSKDFEKLQDLPDDYKDFLKAFDGAVGYVGNNENYLDLWPIKDIIELNPYFSDDAFANEIIVIGSDGSGTLYGYDLKDKQFFEADEFEMNREMAKKCGDSFLDFLSCVEDKEY